MHPELLGGARDVEVALGVGAQGLAERRELVDAAWEQASRGVVGGLCEVVVERDLLQRGDRSGVAQRPAGLAVAARDLGQARADGGDAGQEAR